MSVIKERWYDLIDAFNSTSRYMDDLLNEDNIHFDHMVHRIYTAEPQLYKANASDTETAFLDLNLSIHNDIVSTKIYDKPNDLNFDFVNFPFLDGDVLRRPSYGVYISQLIRFARASSHVTDFNVFGVGVSCRKLYSFVVYLYVNGSVSITSVGEERANLSAVFYL